jgi:flagellar biosynthesis/type III secretory pathway protein FliH
LSEERIFAASDSRDEAYQGGYKEGEAIGYKDGLKEGKKIGIITGKKRMIKSITLVFQNLIEDIIEKEGLRP